MTDWTVVFLGVIAAATLLMALIQVGAIVAVARVARQAQLTLGTAQQALAAAQQAVGSVREEVRPLVARAAAVADEASKSAVLARAQAEKIDRLVTDVVRRIDETSVVVQDAIVKPAREGIAVVAALKAALAVLRHAGDPRRGATRSEEEDPLFIG